MVSTIGVNLRVTGHCNQGGRKYMEDAFVVAYQQTENERDLEYAYFGIFDGHGGREAALYAKDNLMDHIVNQKNFWSDDDDLVLKAIRDGFITTHLAMWKEVGNWPKTVSGLPSTSGTTSSIAFIRQGKLYIGHAGDSKIVLGYQEPGSSKWLPLSLTKDHKPESPKEKKRIYSVGGLVMNKAGVERVVWNRPHVGHKGPITRSTPFDQIPFLAVSRSLGDLWSYNYLRREFVVSPEPDVTVFTLDPKRDRCIVLATDGLWNMVSTRDAIAVVQAAEEENEQLILEGNVANNNNTGKSSTNPSTLLVDRALNRWYLHRMRADNTSVVTVLLDPPGPPKSEVLLKQKIMQKLRPRDEQAESEPLPQPQNDLYTLELKTPKKVPADNACIKPPDENSLQKEKKKSPDLVTWVNKLPKPVVLSPQRVMVKHRLTLWKPQNSSLTGDEENPKKKNEDSCVHTPYEQPPQGSVSAVGIVNRNHQDPVNEFPKEQRKVLCPDSKGNIEAVTSPTNKRINCPPLPPSPLCKPFVETTPQPSLDIFVKENDQNGNVACSSTESCKNSVAPISNDSAKESGRTHLSEVDNIVKAEDLEGRLGDLSRTISRVPEVLPKIVDDSCVPQKLHGDEISSLNLKRKRDDEDSEPVVPTKSLRLSRSSLLRDRNSCNRGTRPKLRIRKVK